MPRVQCECGYELITPDDSADGMVTCPQCQAQLVIPKAVVDTKPAERSDRPPSSNRDEVDASQTPSTKDVSVLAIVSLILGCSSLCCSVLTAFPGVILGLLATDRIKKSHGRVTGQGLAVAGILLSCLGAAVNGAGIYWYFERQHRESEERVVSSSNIKDLALAMLRFNAEHGSLPPQGFAGPIEGRSIKPLGPDRKPLLSWRVAILPYMNEKNLYSQFKLDEPWNGPNNLKLLAKMPRQYRLPGDDETKPDHTHYQVFVGNGALFDNTRRIAIHSLPRGTSETILIVEAEQAVPWTKPEDIEFNPSKPAIPLLSRRLSTQFNSVTLVAMADGTVHSVNLDTISETTLKQAIALEGKEPLGDDW